MRTEDAVVAGGGFAFGEATTKNDMVVTIEPQVLNRYVNGMEITIRPAETTDGSSTVDLNGMGAKKVYLGSNQSTQVTSQLVANSVYKLVYNSKLDSDNGGFAVIGI